MTKRRFRQNLAVTQRNPDENANGTQTVEYLCKLLKSTVGNCRLLQC